MSQAQTCTPFEATRETTTVKVEPSGDDYLCLFNALMALRVKSISASNNMTTSSFEIYRSNFSSFKCAEGNTYDKHVFSYDISPKSVLISTINFRSML